MPIGSRSLPGINDFCGSLNIPGVRAQLDGNLEPTILCSDWKKALTPKGTFEYNSPPHHSTTLCNTMHSFTLTVFWVAWEHWQMVSFGWWQMCFAGAFQHHLRTLCEKERKRERERGWMRTQPKWDQFHTLHLPQKLSSYCQRMWLLHSVLIVWHLPNMLLHDNGCNLQRAQIWLVTPTF